MMMMMMSKWESLVMRPSEHYVIGLCSVRDGV